jgi:hypothetical protein
MNWVYACESINLDGDLLSLIVEELHVLYCWSCQIRNFWQDPDPEQIIIPDSGISKSEMNLKQKYTEKLIK